MRPAGVRERSERINPARDATLNPDLHRDISSLQSSTPEQERTKNRTDTISRYLIHFLALLPIDGPMKEISVLFSTIAVLAGCVSSPPGGNTPVAEIHVQGTSIIYRGSISRESNERFFKIIETSDLTLLTLIITSKGGDALAGVELGKWVFRNGIDVTVIEYCVSSCANYVFPAGKIKTLDSSAAVVWHGGALQKEWNNPCLRIPKSVLEKGRGCSDIEQIQAESLQEFRSTEALFFAEIGVDQRVTVLGQVPEYDCRGGSRSLGWYYSIDDLARLGIKNIDIQQGEWRPESPASNLTICRVELGADFH